VLASLDGFFATPENPRGAAPRSTKRGQHPDEAKQITVEDADRLMARVRSRDATAFEALYDGYHRLVYGIALRMLGDVTSAEDLTQAVFLKVWSSPGTFAGGNFPAWIARVARNRCLDALRSRAPQAHAEIPESLPDDEQIEDRAFARLDAEAVRRALEKLPAEQREPIELGFFGGITHEEIARRSGIPLGTIKTRIRSGLRKLRTNLEGALTV
jgi:RNA polymerase sigma-70 factor (ECF subfamily)